MIYGSLTFLVLVDRSPLTRPLRARFFYPFSRLAFGMYLNHFWFAHWSTAWTITHLSGALRSPVLVFLAGLVFGTAISAGVALISFIIIEHPFLMLREYWLGERVPAPTRESITAPATGDAGVSLQSSRALHVSSGS